MKLICQYQGAGEARNSIKVKQGHISECTSELKKKKMPVFPVAKGVPFQLLEKITELDVRMWVFCLTPAFPNCTFLFCVLLTCHFNMKGHLSFVSVHIHLSAFEVAKSDVPGKVIFVAWVWRIYSVPGVFFRHCYAFCCVNVKEMQLVSLNPFLEPKLKETVILIKKLVC